MHFPCGKMCKLQQDSRSMRPLSSRLRRPRDQGYLPLDAHGFNMRQQQELSLQPSLVLHLQHPVSSVDKDELQHSTHLSCREGSAETALPASESRAFRMNSPLRSACLLLQVFPSSLSMNSSWHLQAQEMPSLTQRCSHPWSTDLQTSLPENRQFVSFVTPHDCPMSQHEDYKTFGSASPSSLS